MPAGGVFRIDPPPVQRSPTAPILRQGDVPAKQPPLGSNNAALIMRAWEPPPPMPTQKWMRAPVPLQGQQPVPGPRPLRVMNDWIRRSWEPPDPQPTQKVLRAPVPKQGDVPSPPMELLDDYLPLLLSWQPVDIFRPQYVKIAPLIPVVVVAADLPFASTVNQGIVARSWLPSDPSPPREPLAPIPQQGSQPTPQASPSVFFSIVRSWQPPDPLPVQRGPSFPIAVQGDQPPRASPAVQVRFWQPADAPPVLPAKLVPIPPVVVAGPPPTSSAVMQSLARSWQPTESFARQSPGIAPLIPVVVSTLPRWSPVVMLSLVSSWIPPLPQPQQGRRDVVPLTLPYGQQPPRMDRVNQTIVAQAWVPPHWKHPARSTFPWVTVAPPDLPDFIVSILLGPATANEMELSDAAGVSITLAAQFPVNVRLGDA